MTINMADSAESAALNGLTVEAFAAYVDGELGDQPNAGRVAVMFPNAHHLTIALSGAHDADCLDVENGAASPSDVPGWIQRQHARGVKRPCVYASVAPMRDEIIPLIAPGAIVGWDPRLWTAHYEWKPGAAAAHICGPHTCGELPTDADGTQWCDNYHGPNGVVDMSLLDDSFFGEPASAWVFTAVRGLTALAGHESVLLSWSSPGQPAPGAVHHYQVTVRRDGEDVPRYPRTVPKEGNPQSWQGGSLEPGTGYEAMVRAMTADGSHASPWAAVSFTTGRA